MRCGNQTCGGNKVCVANVCTKKGVCTPKTACDPGQCGLVTDGCADVLRCGACPGSMQCINNVCQ
jgi:hypothetical protein